MSEHPREPDANEPGTRDVDRRSHSTWGGFTRGLSLGALVGAAIAGSAIWDRLRKRDEPAPHEPVDRDVDAG